jgi:hypothetical protein
MVLGILAGLLAAAAPGGAAGGWDQAYGNLANTSFVNATTNVPVVANWSFTLDGEVGTSGPAVDSVSGVIYLGTANGTFWSFLPDGNVHCQRIFKEMKILSVPAIFPNGDIAILVTRPLGDKRQTALARLAPDCGVVWKVDLPTMFGNPSFTSGSAKIWTLDGNPFIFVHVLFSNWDLSLPPESFHELVVFDERGQIFARHPVGATCIELRGGGWFRKTPPAELAPQVTVTNDWPDSTPAILDLPLHGFSTPRSPLVAVTEHRCHPRLEVLQFDPAAATVPGRLIKRWGAYTESEGTKMSGPAVTPEGLIVFGTSGYRVRIYDLNTLSLKCSFDSTYSVMHPPALTPDAWIVPAEYAVHFLKPGTDTLAPTARPQPYYTLGSATGLAASLNEVVVPNLQELGIWAHDLRSLTHALTAQEFRTSPPALTPEGRLYVVAQTTEKSVLYAFGPP